MSIYLHVYVGAWIRESHLTPVLLPEESHGQRSLVGYSLWVTESDMTERLMHTHICGYYTYTERIHIKLTCGFF